jgi:nucleotide-binding universal stress UspA family protein
LERFTGPTFSSILAAVDPAPHDAAANALNTKILDLAVSLASLDGAALHIVHAYGGHESALEAKWGSWMHGRDPGQFLRQIHRVREEAIQRDLARYDLAGVDHSVHLIRGEPQSAILGVARHHEADLIVMATVCRTGIAGFFLGNTAESVLARAECSMLAVKPDSFVSPVTLPEDGGAQ